MGYSITVTQASFGSRPLSSVSPRLWALHSGFRGSLQRFHFRRPGLWRGCLGFNQHPSCFCCGWSADVRQCCPADDLKASSVWDTGDSGSGGRGYADSYSSLLPFNGDFIPQSWALPQSLWALETSQRYLGRDTAGHDCKTLQLEEGGF